MNEWRLDKVSLTGRLNTISIALPGQCVSAIMGQNGSGKTSLLHVLGGLLKPDAGTITHQGEMPGSVAMQARYRACVPQHAQLPSGFRVSDILNQTTHDIEFWRFLQDYLQLDELCMHATHELSGGQAQRVLLARAALQVQRAAQPWLLLDEPAAALDIAQQGNLLKWFSALREKGWSIVYTTHSIDQAMLADYVALMRTARVIAAGAPHEAITSGSLKAVYDCAFTRWEKDGVSLWRPAA